MPPGDRPGLRAGQQGIRRLRQHVERQGEKRCPDQPQRHALPLLADALELPHDDERREDLDQRVEPEAGQGDRSCLECRHDDDPRADDIPAEGDIFKV